MTYTLPKDLTHCYALLFTGESEYKDGKHLRAMLCFEECRMLAEQKIVYNEIFNYLDLYISGDKNEPLVYVCQNYSCKLPTNDIEKIKKILNNY